MADFTAKFEVNKFVVYRGNHVFGQIIFEGNTRVSARILVDNTEYTATPESAANKDIVLKENDDVLLKFKFDKLWGGADLYVDGEKTGYKITGKALKPGTHLVDGDKDLVTVVSKQTLLALGETEINVLHPEVTSLLVMATFYYHIYLSAAATMTLVSGII